MDELTDQLHVWYLWLDQPSRLALPPQWNRWPVAHEVQQYQAFVFERDRRRYAWTRWLVRHVLAQYAAVDPLAWVFAPGAYGRPQIMFPPTPLIFNLSHTHSAIVCVVGREPEIGIDIEELTRVAPLELAEHVFAPQEQMLLKRAAPHAQAAVFWQLWTLKEAYIKARGMGLSLPLEKVAFTALKPPIKLLLDPTLEDVADDWHFTCYCVEQHWQIALAQRIGKARPSRVIKWRNGRDLIPDSSLD